MAHRTFMDAHGVTWEAWDVRPSWSWTDRRHRQRRDHVEPPPGAERRHGDRRHPEGAMALRAGYESGWLTFECAGSRRRLTPIPDGWEKLPDLTLAELCRRATDVGQRPRLVE